MVTSSPAGAYSQLMVITEGGGTITWKACVVVSPSPFTIYILSVTAEGISPGMSTSSVLSVIKLELSTASLSLKNIRRTLRRLLPTKQMVRCM